jgi:hypothetical protein
VELHFVIVVTFVIAASKFSGAQHIAFKRVTGTAGSPVDSWLILNPPVLRGPVRDAVDEVSVVDSAGEVHLKPAELRDAERWLPGSELPGCVQSIPQDSAVVQVQKENNCLVAVV